MKRILGKKQNITNDEWLKAMEQIEDLVSKKELDTKVKETVSEIKEKTKGKNTAYGWSAGKDSIVLGKICEKAGIKKCVLVRSNLEYKAFTDWIENNQPEGLTVINTGQDIKWLSKHPQMLFPKDSKIASQWFHIVQHRGQAQYYKDNSLDMLLLGRRRADGNYVGSSDNVYTNNDGITRYSPLADWTHEEVLAYIHYYKCPLPPIYDWKNGYLCGTHSWPARQWTGSTENGWKEVLEIEPGILEEAKEYFPEIETIN